MHVYSIFHQQEALFHSMEDSAAWCCVIYIYIYLYMWIFTYANIHCCNFCNLRIQKLIHHPQ